jgi:hypothetical protein
MLNPEQPFAMVGAGSRKQRPYFGCLQQPQTQLAASAGREKCSLTVHAGLREHLYPLGTQAQSLSSCAWWCCTGTAAWSAQQCLWLRSVQTSLFSCAYDDVYKRIQAAMQPVLSVCAGMAVVVLQILCM